MTTRARSTVRCAVATILALSAGVAAAEESSSDRALEEVVVTAQKKSERLIDVPVSITSVSSDTLTKENLVSISDFFSRIPGLQFANTRTYSLALRGVTTGGANNPTLALLIDDVQFGGTIVGGLGNSRFPDIDPSNLERIEVLRGPQGTLYGAASLGGVLKYVTKQPNLNDFSARVEAGYSTVAEGSEGHVARGMVNLPLFSNHAALMVSGFDREDPPYIDNVSTLLPGTDVNKAHTYGGRVAFLWKPMESLSVTLSALRQKRDAEFTSSVQSLPLATGSVPNYTPRFGRAKINAAKSGDIGNQEFYTGRVEWDLGAVQLTSLTAWSESLGTNVTDVSRVFTFIPPAYGFTPPTTAAVTILDIGGTKKFSQELRLAGKAGAIDWRAGLFYTKEDGRIDQTLLLYDPAGALFDTPYNAKGPVEYKEKAVFGDAVWHVTDKWDVQAGVRYAKNEQHNGGGLTVTTPQVVPFFGPTATAPIIDSDDSSFTFAVSPSYKFNPDLMLYARVASGYRPGGPNDNVPGAPASFDPDTVINYEVGLKGYRANRTVSFDLAAFQIDWTDVQLQNTAQPSNFTFRTNGGKATSRGFEASVEVQPREGLTISANATFLDAELSENLPTLTNAASLRGVAGDALPTSARYTGNVAIEQRFNIAGSMKAYVGGNLSLIGTRHSEFVNSTAVNAQRFDWPSYSLLDLRAGLETESQWRVDVFARNVTDKEGVLFASNRNGTSTSSVTFVTPRTIGVNVSKSF